VASKVITCKDNYFINAAKDACTACGTLTTNVKKCSSATAIEKCNTGYTLINNECV